MRRSRLAALSTDLLLLLTGAVFVRACLDLRLRGSWVLGEGEGEREGWLNRVVEVEMWMSGCSNVEQKLTRGYQVMMVNA